MTIQGAIEAAEKSNESCIRRPIGMMRVRILDMSDPTNGILAGDTVGPIGGLLPTQAHYELTPDDICALNWSVADGVKLEPAEAEPDKPSAITNATMTEVIRSAAVHISRSIADWEPANDADSLAMLKTMAEALEDIGRARESLTVESADMPRISGYTEAREGATINHDNQQETGK